MATTNTTKSTFQSDSSNRDSQNLDSCEGYIHPSPTNTYLKIAVQASAITPRTKENLQRKIGNAVKSVLRTAPQSQYINNNRNDMERGNSCGGVRRSATNNNSQNPVQQRVQKEVPEYSPINVHIDVLVARSRGTITAILDALGEAHISNSRTKLRVSQACRKIAYGEEENIDSKEVAALEKFYGAVLESVREYKLQDNKNVKEVSKDAKMGDDDKKVIKTKKAINKKSKHRSVSFKNNKKKSTHGDKVEDERDELCSDSSDNDVDNDCDSSS